MYGTSKGEFDGPAVGSVRVSSDNDWQTTHLQRDALLAQASIRGSCLAIRPAGAG